MRFLIGLSNKAILRPWSKFAGWYNSNISWGPRLHVFYTPDSGDICRCALVDNELVRVQQWVEDWNNPFLIRTIAWLHSVSSNTTVRRVAAQALAASPADQSQNSWATSKGVQATDWESSGLLDTLFDSYLGVLEMEPDIGGGVAQPDIKPRAGRSAYIRAAENLRIAHSDCFLRCLSLRLAEAVHKQQSKVVAHILAHDVDVNVPRCNGEPALYLASKLGDAKLVKLLLEKGAHLNHVLDNRDTALHIASSMGHLKCVEVLLDHGSDVNGRDSMGNIALHDAAESGQLAAVNLLLARGADIHNSGGYWGTALQAASYRGHLDIVKLLLERGADVNAVGRHESRSALQLATERGYAEVVAFLKNYGAG